jgi:hypothetical protein
VPGEAVTNEAARGEICRSGWFSFLPVPAMVSVSHPSTDGPVLAERARRVGQEGNKQRGTGDASFVVSCSQGKQPEIIDFKLMKKPDSVFAAA